jgi:hypothetical protein
MPFRPVCTRWLPGGMQQTIQPPSADEARCIMTKAFSIACVNLTQIRGLARAGCPLRQLVLWQRKSPRRLRTSWLGQIQTIEMCLYLLWRRKRSPNKQLGAHRKA